MALEWIYENVAAFGGDPAKIVFVGQGFGGVSALVHALEFKPARVIASSASIGMKFAFPDNSWETSESLKAKLKCKDTLLDCLATYSTSEILAASQNVGIWPFGLVDDGDLINNPKMENLESDLLLGFNTGDTFGWANEFYYRLNKYPIGIEYDELEVIKYTIETDFMKQTPRSQLGKPKPCLFFKEQVSDDERLYERYGNDALYPSDKQLSLREAIMNFYFDEGIIHPVIQDAKNRNGKKTFVYKFAVNRFI